jgi:hypothetical protein
MKTLLFLLLLPTLLSAQTSNDGRQLIALTINSDPDQTDGPNKYYLLANKPSCVKLIPHQTFLLQSAWHQSGDSVVTIGAGTVNIINDTTVEMNSTIYDGKKIQKGDMALFLVPLQKPLKDTLFFKMARLDIVLKTVEDSLFYDRNKMLENSSSYGTDKLVEAMVADIRYTGKEMKDRNNSQDMEITTGIYKGQTLFDMMQKTTSTDLLKFLLYVYARPDKYKAHEWKVSEIFATWVISGTPLVGKG